MGIKPNLFLGEPVILPQNARSRRPPIQRPARCGSGISFKCRLAPEALAGARAACRHVGCTRRLCNSIRTACCLLRCSLNWSVIFTKMPAAAAAGIRESDRPIHFLVPPKSSCRSLPSEASTQLTLAWTWRTSPIQDLAQVGINPRVRTCIAVAIEGVEHVVADVQFDPAVSAE
jgi:hypothetical protein